MKNPYKIGRLVLNFLYNALLGFCGSIVMVVAVIAPALLIFDGEWWSYLVGPLVVILFFALVGTLVYFSLWLAIKWRELEAKWEQRRKIDD